MTTRGDDTRKKLIAATGEVVRNVGYAKATTKAIAQAAGVAEGTIYRHFPDKVALFFATAVSGSQSIIEELATLPDLAGTATVESNLERALRGLLELRQELLPLEIALISDPELVKRRQTMEPPELIPGLLSPPEAIGQYLQKEATLGRVRMDVDPRQVAVLLLSSLFGVMVSPTSAPQAAESPSDQISTLVSLLMNGIKAPA